MDYKEIYESWLANPYFDEGTKAELLSIKADDKEIKERFYKDLEFGTAGLRGIIGAGTNRMNIYTVRKTTQGLANYIKKQHGESKGVAIAFDSRRMSPEFASEAALCLAANGIKAYLFESLRPTPELSFAVRELGCIAGINITASHNPPEYNGYKVYWEDGAQITPPHDSGIMGEVQAVTDYNDVLTMDKDEAVKAGLCTMIGKDIDDKYISRLKEQVKHPEAIQVMGKDLKIVYTPLHGTGNIPARRILKELGFENVYVVPEQELPDGEFPTVSYPNPEADEAFVLGLKLAKEVDADLVLATDPDADRLGVRVKDKNGEYQLLTGNQTGMLLFDYICSQRTKHGKMPADPVMVKTIVSMDMAEQIAKNYGVRVINVLTGFKFIGEQIGFLEKQGKEDSYIFGFEESYGYLSGSYVRDKDAVNGAFLICEMFSYYATKGISLLDKLNELFDKYGYCLNTLHSYQFEGSAGFEKMQKIMESFREEVGEGKKIESFAGKKINTVLDYSKGLDGLPKSDVLKYLLDGNCSVVVRPSGTEPKLKTYISVSAKSKEDAEVVEKKIADELGEFFA